MIIKISAKDLRSLGIKKKNGNKYHAKRHEYNGQKYDSIAEAKRAMALDLMIKARQIHRYIRQVPIELGHPANKYRVDFLVFGKNQIWAEDVKGFETPKFKRDMKLWKTYGPCPLLIIKGNQQDWIYPIDQDHTEI